MKKSVIKISLAFGIIVMVLLILLGLRSIDEDGTIPSYRFLDGQNPTSYKDEKIGEFYGYSFEADFNDVCLKADAELIGAGFVDRTRPGNKSSERRYYLKSRFPRGPVDIRIHYNHEHIKHSISKKGRLLTRGDWIEVEIGYWRGWLGLF